MVACLVALLCSTIPPTDAYAALLSQGPVVDQAAAPAPSREPQETPRVPPTDPWAQRPVCESLFLQADWKLSSKQKACDWAQNRLFSLTVLTSTTWSAAAAPTFTSLMGHDAAPGGFTKRFGANLAQNAFKSTATYLSAMIEHEDPRAHPPFLILTEHDRRPRGVWHRVGDALLANFISYRCDNQCAEASDVRKVAALSRITGAVASGLSSELWSTDRSDRHARAARGIGSAYAATFASSLAVEFQPELNAAINRVLTFIGGSR